MHTDLQPERAEDERRWVVDGSGAVERAPGPSTTWADERERDEPVVIPDLEPASGADQEQAAEPPPGPTRGWRQAVVVVVLAIVLLVAGLAISRATAGVRPGPKAAPLDATPAPPRGPGSIVYDRFDRNSGVLGKAETGQPWAVVGAPWRADGQHALVADGAPGRTIAVVRGASSDGTAQVRMPVVAAGTGLVFRFKDALDYWSLTAAPASGTWNLQRVVNGTATAVGTSGKTGAADGTTIAVRFSGPDLAVLLNGVEVASFQDDALEHETGVGLLGVANDTRLARWDSFVMSAPVSPASASASATSASPG